MNDTILLNDRQEAILKLIEDKGELPRLALSKLVSFRKPISKITLIRDINYLINAKLLLTKGKGRATRYMLPNLNPLLKYLDLNEYFNKEPEAREGKINFDTEIFGKLKNLFTEQEKTKWNQASIEFKKRITRLDANIKKRELERFIVEFSWKSAQIEGNTYDLLETETLLTQNIEAEGHSKEEAEMLINHKKAFDTILKNKEDFKVLNFRGVIQLHEVLTRGLTTAGIRKQTVRIAGTSYIPDFSGSDLKTHLQKTIKVINETDFPPQKALIAAVMIAYIQPFVDGNKRTGRTLSNAILLAHDFFPLSYRNVDVNEYKKALIIFYEQNNLYQFKKIFSQQLKFALNNYFNYAKIT
ncbi:MAG: Fic family protein [bacterium]|nr:Fic family protein [bacterium]